MVCAKCQTKLKRTELATPSVKQKNEIYHGSPTGDKNKPTLSGGISKVCTNILKYTYLTDGVF